MINYNHSDLQIRNKQASDRLTAFDNVLFIITKSSWKKALNIKKKYFSFKYFKLNKITPNHARSLYYNISTKFYQQKKIQQNWLDNQLHLFTWLLITYSFAVPKQVDQFEQQQWRIFSIIFCRKSTTLLKYEYLNFKKNPVENSKEWQFEQKQMLNQILKQFTDPTKWNIIAQQLFIRSQQKYFRTPKNCQERWYKYLNPNTSKNYWSNQEDYNLIKAIKQNGKKWVHISKTVFSGRRTQHALKNRYNTLQLRYIKSINMPLKEDVYIQAILEWMLTGSDSDSIKSEQILIKDQQIYQKSQINFSKENIKVQYLNQKQQQQQFSIIKFEEPITLPVMYMDDQIDQNTSKFGPLGIHIKKQQLN